jgi:hypothetical protein
MLYVSVPRHAQAATWGIFCIVFSEGARQSSSRKRSKQKRVTRASPFIVLYPDQPMGVLLAFAPAPEVFTRMTPD